MKKMKKKTLRPYFARVFREFRGEKTQKEFALELGISHQQQYQRYESGKNEAPFWVLQNIAKTRNWSVERFIRHVQAVAQEDLEGRQDTFGEYYLSREELVLLQEYGELVGKQYGQRFESALRRFLEFWRIGDPDLITIIEDFLDGLKKIIDKFPRREPESKK
jgi:hypothetical protein